MGKKYPILIFFLLCAAMLHGQVLMSILFGDKLNSDGLEFGLDTGANWSEISDLDSSSYLRTFNIGFYFDIRLKKQWSLYTGILAKANMGSNELSEDDLLFLNVTLQPEEGTYSQRLNYFIAPVMFRYKFPNRFYLEAGPQFALMYKSFVQFYSDSGDEEILIKNFNKDAIRKFDAGISGGLGYKLKPVGGLTLGLRYYYGLTNVYKDRSGTKNSSIFLKANFPVGAGKKEKNKGKGEGGG